MTHTFAFWDRVHVQFEIRFYVHFLILAFDTPRPIRYWRWCNWQRYTVHQNLSSWRRYWTSDLQNPRRPATLNKQIEAEPDLNNNQIYYCGIIAVLGGLMLNFVDFIGHPYPPIYIFSNLYLIIQISKHRFYHFKQSHAHR